MPDILPRRRILLASATALPMLLATAGCRSSDLFTGPDPLAGRPRPAPDVVTLAAVIAAEENLIGLYRAALAGSAAADAGSSTLRPLLAQHEQHLTQLRARLVLPPGTASTPAGTPSAQASPSARAGSSAGAPGQSGGSGGSGSGSGGSGSGPVTVARLRAAEHASAGRLVQQLATVEPALAQLFASIAASDATHVTALGG